MIFPDNESSLQTLHVPEFHEGYLATAKIYHKQTGRKLLIYPLCSSRRGNLLELGEPVEYNPDSPFRDECKRINAYLLCFIRQRYWTTPDMPAQQGYNTSV